jgi:Uma2 family endonuclease
MALTIETEPSSDQVAFNLKRWSEILADRELARLPHRIETDRHGHILMSPPPAPKHGRKQYQIGVLLEKHLRSGFAMIECPISTSDGIKAVDVAWLEPKRSKEADSSMPLTRAPEICVEITSPSNTKGAIEDKRMLYFGAGAEEVWICDQRGNLHFYTKDSPEAPAQSKRCPRFPAQIR